MRSTLRSDLLENHGSMVANSLKAAVKWSLGEGSSADEEAKITKQIQLLRVRREKIR